MGGTAGYKKLPSLLGRELFFLERGAAMFDPVSSKVDFPALEREILAFWEENGIVEKYLSRNEGAEKRASFIDGPITANNPMGVHHAWGRTYKDMFLRYRAMKGFDQRFQNGFDGQGLWIEVEVEKELGFTSKRDIEAYGIDKFVELCKERVLKFAGVISDQSVRLGYWMDWNDSYHTMSDENNYTIWLFLKKCHERGWIYEGRDVMPWCPRCGTGLSQHEIVTEGYQEVEHPGLYVRFPLRDRPGESLLVWTTTPWTLTSNTAVAVHPEHKYVKVRHGGETLYVAKALVSALRGESEVLEELQGREVVGLRYDGPFDELPVQEGVEHRVVAWDEVSENEGTGIVHIAPGAGAEDFALSRKLGGLGVIAPLDEFGDFVEGFDWLTGRNVYDVNESIYASLKEKGVFYRVEKYRHRYPLCWRCGSELVYRLVDEWFISMDELRGLVADVAAKITWLPAFGLQRELDWLRNMDDWMISKKRYWGLALPIYKCSCGHFEVIGSDEELRSRATKGWDEFQGHSPHRPWIDAVKIDCPKCGGEVSRIADVGNPWLDAGIVSFSTIGYRKDREYWRKWFPADWITESFPGQFRNWFYSLLTMSTVLEGREPTRTVHSYALMRDEHGDEMHKSKGNAIWFEDAAERMGADAMRWLYSRHNPAANLNFGFEVADDVRRRLIIPLWNVYSFFVTYANIDRFDPSVNAPEVSERAELDRWIISELNTVIAEVTDALDAFQPERGARAVEEFVEYLSNWYVRRSRRRFWKSGLVGGADAADHDKLSAYATLYECLVTLTKLLAPFMPFLTESMYRNLAGSGNGGCESVHLDDYPEVDRSKIDARLSAATRLAMRLSSLGRSARGRAGIKVRQPLAEALFLLRSADEAEMLPQIEAQVRDELNVKGVALLEDAASVVSLEIKPNLPLLGPKYGREVPIITALLSRADAREVHGQVNAGQPVQLEDYSLQPDEVILSSMEVAGYSVASGSGYTVAVTTDVSEEMRLEGMARELVHRLQNMRREAGFDIADRIETFYRGNEEIGRVLSVHGEYVEQETLSRAVVDGEPPEGAHVESHRIDGLDVTLGVLRAE